MEKFRINPISGEVVPISENKNVAGTEPQTTLGEFIPHTEMKNAVSERNKGNLNTNKCINITDKQGFDAAETGYDFEVGAETTKPIAERGRSNGRRKPDGGIYAKTYTQRSAQRGGTNEKGHDNVHPGDPSGGENIPPTAPSRVTVPKVPNRAWTEMSVGENRDESDEETDGKNGKTEPEKERHDRTVTTKSGDKLIKTIVIAGQIEGHSQLPQGQKATRYEELIPQLVEIEEDDEIEGLLLILNTVGGDVEAGLALSELIAGMKKPTASLVLGGGHSIGVPLAVSAKKSFIVPSATMTLHPVRITGMVLGAPQTYVYMSKMQARIVDFTCKHCKMSPERFNELMLSRDEMSTDLGSVLDGSQAVSEGLIDSLGALGDAINYLRSQQRN